MPTPHVSTKRTVNTSTVEENVFSLRLVLHDGNFTQLTLPLASGGNMKNNTKRRKRKILFYIFSECTHRAARMYYTIC